MRIENQQKSRSDQGGRDQGGQLGPTERKRQLQKGKEEATKPSGRTRTTVGFH